MEKEYEVKYKILIKYLIELTKKNYVSKEDIEFILYVFYDVILNENEKALVTTEEAKDE